MKNNIQKILDRFDETKFAKEGGSCFECCDYENMYLELKQFIQQEITKALEEQKENIKQDINSVLNMLDGNTERKKIANFIREYLNK